MESVAVSLSSMVMVSPENTALPVPPTVIVSSPSTTASSVSEKRGV